MHKKVASNGLVYLLTAFVSVGIILVVVARYKPLLFPEGESSIKKGGVISDAPGKEFAGTILFMLSDTKAADPLVYVLLSYEPEGGVSITPLPPETLVNLQNNASLGRIYSNFGAEEAVRQISEYFSLVVTEYVKFDRSAFVDFINVCGEVQVDVPTKMVLHQDVENIVNGIDVDDNGDSVLFYAGANVLDGEALFRYMTFNDYTKDKSENIALQQDAIGVSLKRLIDSKFRSLAKVAIQNRFDKLFLTTRNSFTEEGFYDYLSAFLYTTDLNGNLASYDAASGWLTSDGLYNIPSNAISGLIIKTEKK